MSTLVTRGEEVKLKCNYYISVRGGEEHRNLESQYGSQTSAGAVNGGDKYVYFVPDAPLKLFWSLRNSPPLLTKPTISLGADAPLSVRPG